VALCEYTLVWSVGVAYGATATSCMGAAVIAGIVVPARGGARFQISGPTGAMSAVLIVVAGRYGLEGVWLTGVLAGLMIILMGVLKWGQEIGRASCRERGMI